MQTKRLHATLDAADTTDTAGATNTVSHRFTATISTDTVDADGEVLLPQGMDAADYEKNPVVFWNHDYDKPIGQANRLSRQDTSWTAEATLAARPESHQGPWLPDTVLALMQQGVLRGVSVGFVPIQSRPPTEQDRTRFGPTVRRIYSQWKLLEFSVVALPANAEALVSAVSKGVIAPQRCRELFPEVTLPEPRMKRYVVMLPDGGVRQAARDAVLKAKGCLYA